MTAELPPTTEQIIDPSVEMCPELERKFAMCGVNIAAEVMRCDADCPAPGAPKYSVTN
jgi:hypothetical protein